MIAPRSWLENDASKTVLILGDVMLDRFVYCDATRISPEAPIPVLTVRRQDTLLGGAGNVARNVVSLGGRAVLIGICGLDTAGHTVQDLVAQAPNIEPALVISAARVTTEKVRYVAGRQQVLRSDTEDTAPAISEAALLIEAFLQHLPRCNVVVLSDYAKGVLCDVVLNTCISEARKAGKPVIVDPKCRDMRRYNGASIVTPNLEEAMRATNLECKTDDEVSEVASAILEQAPDVHAVLISRGQDGMTLTERGKVDLHIGGEAREVFDVAGAGDTVVAALALGIGAGVPFPAAAEIANLAAGIVVSKVGTATVSLQELSAAYRAKPRNLVEAKLLSLLELCDKVRAWRSRGGTIGFTNGCFDLIHSGHVSLLSRAREQCGYLIVGINSDSSVRRLKGEGRPVQDETTRQRVIAALAAVDAVVLFDQDTPQALIEALRPDVLFKGADYEVREVAGGDFVRSCGGRIVLIPVTPGQSTTATIAKLTRRTVDESRKNPTSLEPGRVEHVAGDACANVPLRTYSP